MTHKEKIAKIYRECEDWPVEDVERLVHELQTIIDDKECEHQFTEDSLYCVLCGKSRQTMTDYKRSKY